MDNQNIVNFTNYRGPADLQPNDDLVVALRDLIRRMRDGEPLKPTGSTDSVA